MAKSSIIQALSHADKFVSSTYIKLFKEKNALMSFLFHGVFKDRKDAELHQVDPQQATTVDDFREFIEYFVSNDFEFITPKDIINGLNENKNYVLATFDDGYYNNNYVLPILKEYKVPTVFYVSANHVKEGKCFWWDVIYRERKRRGVEDHLISEEQQKLKRLTNEAIEEYIIAQFGENSLRPVSDQDRPMTPEELVYFATQPFVYIGNHTHNHAILTNYSKEGIMDEIRLSQLYLHSLIGQFPDSIAYPNGNFSEEIIQLCRNMGLKLGVTLTHRKNYLPFENTSDQIMMLNRFTLWGNESLSISRQCELYRSDIQLMTLLKQVVRGKFKAH